MPGRAGTRQARRFGAPSIVTRQSKHTPMPQNSPRGRPATRVVRQERMPAAHSAAATVCPGRTGTSRPSKVSIRVMADPTSAKRAGRNGAEVDRGRRRR